MLYLFGDNLRVAVESLTQVFKEKPPTMTSEFKFMSIVFSVCLYGSMWYRTLRNTVEYLLVTVMERVVVMMHNATASVYVMVSMTISMCIPKKFDLPFWSFIKGGKSYVVFDSV